MTTRKIRITQDTGLNSTIELLSANDELIMSGTVQATKSMSDMFTALGNKVNPVAGAGA